MTHSHATVRVLRWTARVRSAANPLLVFAFAIGDGLLAGMLTANEWIGIALFRAGVLFWQALAWWREGWGGGMTLAFGRSLAPSRRARTAQLCSTSVQALLRVRRIRERQPIRSQTIQR